MHTAGQKPCRNPDERWFVVTLPTRVGGGYFRDCWRSGAFGFSSRGLPGLVSARLHVDLRRKMPRGALAAPPAGDPRGTMHPMERQGVVLEPTLAGRQPVMSLWPLRTRREHLRREHRRPLWAVVTQQFADRERAADREQASGDRPDLQERRGRTISRTTSKSIPLMISPARCFEDGLPVKLH